MHPLHASSRAPVSPTWFGARWHAAATAWVDDALVSRGLRRTGAAEQVRIRPWSTLLRVPTDGGTAWMKASAPRVTNEAALYDVLVTHLPDVVLAPVAADAEQGWLLLPDGGPELRQVAHPDTVLAQLAAVLRRYAQLQRACCSLVGELEAVGVPRFSPGELVQQWRRRADPADLAGGAEAALEMAAKTLGAGPVPLSLQHDDLHSGNVFCADDTVAAGEAARFFDWGDAYLGHPFMSLLITLRGPGYHFGIELGEQDRERLLGAYLEPWTDLAPLGELRALVEPAVLLARLGRVLGWERALDRATQAEWEEWGDAPEHWLTDVTRLAAGAGPVW